jgi:Purple acid Phosphatase, N-terminal domain/Calcineurin-like phosphoesterase
MTLNLSSHQHGLLRRLLLLGGCAVLAWGALVLPAAADATHSSPTGLSASHGSLLSQLFALATTEPNDEIHSSLGDSSSQMWLYWHGPDDVVQYGLDSTYGHTATASRPTITPKDLGGLWQVQLTNLAPGTTYHYQIGANGLDHTFETAPTGDFVWDDIGDTATTYSGGGCSKPWMSQVWQQLADEHPDLVTHGGDITYANSCGIPSVHQYWNDIAPLATQTAMEYAWGNHESAGNDSIANYKGRFNAPHAQTIPLDSSSQVASPGCPSPTDPTVNGCQGDDWGYFTAGHVLFISYPEPWSGAFASWQTTADALMAQAEADPDIYFIVTFGHRPAYGNGGISDTTLQPILDALADKYSPAARPDGKYLMNVAHHIHDGQVLAAQHGLLHVIDGGGGDEETSVTKNPATTWLTNHFEHLRVTFTGDKMKLEFICGPPYPTNPSLDACTQGSVLYTQTLTGYQSNGTPQDAQLSTTVTDGGVSNVKVGDTLTYQAGVQNTRLGSTAAGTGMALTVPPNLTVLDAGGATVNANTLSWDLGDLAGGQGATKTVKVQVTSGNAGDSFSVSLQAQTTDSACATSGSVCTASDTDQIVSSSTTKEYVTNTGFESNRIGWTGLYNSLSKTVRYAKAAHDGLYSLKVIRNTTTAGAAGVVSKPSFVPSTTINADFAAGAWVRGQKTGQAQTVVVQVNEVSPAGVVVGSASSSLAFSDLTWHQLQVPYTTLGNGDHLDFVIYSPSLHANAWFLADTVSLLGPPP